MAGARTIAGRSVLNVLALLIATGIVADGALAEGGKASTEPFYQNKRVNLLIGTSPGSSADILGRVIARYLTKHVAGGARVVPQNMPGAGSITMMNHLYN